MNSLPKKNIAYFIKKKRKKTLVNYYTHIPTIYSLPVPVDQVHCYVPDQGHPKVDEERPDEWTMVILEWWQYSQEPCPHLFPNALCHALHQSLGDPLEEAAEERRDGHLGSRFEKSNSNLKAPEIEIEIEIVNKNRKRVRIWKRQRKLDREQKSETSGTYVDFGSSLWILRSYFRSWFDWLPKSMYLPIVSDNYSRFRLMLNFLWRFGDLWKANQIILTISPVIHNN